MQGLSLQPQYCETEQTSLLYKIKLLVVIIVMSKRTSTVSLSRFSAQGRGTDSGHLHIRVYLHVACCMLGCYLLWFKMKCPHLLSWAFEHLVSSWKCCVLLTCFCEQTTDHLKLLNVPWGQAFFWEKMRGKQEGGWEACWGVHLKTALSTSLAHAHRSTSPSPLHRISSVRGLFLLLAGSIFRRIRRLNE